MKWIVLITHQNGSAIPLMREDQYTMHEFDTAKEAGDAARMTAMGQRFGYTILRWDHGVVEVL